MNTLKFEHYAEPEFIFYQNYRNGGGIGQR
jgi:hypothetical protein